MRILFFCVRPSAPALAELGRELGLAILQPPTVNAPEFVVQVQALAPELNLSISYDQILRALILASAPLGFIKVHVGHLSLYRGRNILNWALISGETEVGIPGHFVDEGVDTGDIVVQHTVPVLWEDTYQRGAKQSDCSPAQGGHGGCGTCDHGYSTPPRSGPPHGLLSHPTGARRRMDRWDAISQQIYNKIRAITRPGPAARTLLGRREVML